MFSRETLPGVRRRHLLLLAVPTVVVADYLLLLSFFLPSSSSGVSMFLKFIMFSLAEILKKSTRERLNEE